MTAAPRQGPAPPDDGGAVGLSARRYDSFVVRVLSEARGGKVIGGQVTHVGSRATLRFTDLQRIASFILANLGRRAANLDDGAEPDIPSAHP